jgi:hypothetical protein
LSGSSLDCTTGGGRGVDGTALVGRTKGGFVVVGITGSVVTGKSPELGGILVTGESTANVGGCAVGATVVGVGYTVDVSANPTIVGRGLVDRDNAGSSVGTTVAGVGLNGDIPAFVGRGLTDGLRIVVGVAVVVVESTDPTGAVEGIVEVRRDVG